MILSDRTIRELLANGRIVIDPLDMADIQPSSVDLHLDAVSYTHLTLPTILLV